MRRENPEIKLDFSAVDPGCWSRLGGLLLLDHSPVPLLLVDHGPVPLLLAF